MITNNELIISNLFLNGFKLCNLNLLKSRFSSSKSPLRNHTEVGFLYKDNFLDEALLCCDVSNGKWQTNLLTDIRSETHALYVMIIYSSIL